MARIDDLLAKCERPVSSTPARAAGRSTGRKIAAKPVTGQEWALVAHGGMRPDVGITDPATCREYARLCRAEAERLRFDHPELANALERRSALRPPRTGQRAGAPGWLVVGPRPTQLPPVRPRSRQRGCLNGRV
jgi:hypothetical protein